MNIKHLQQMIVTLGAIVLLTGCGTSKNVQVHDDLYLPKVIAHSLGETNSNWKPIDDAMSQVCSIGDPAVPYLEFAVRLGWHRPCYTDYDLPFSTSSARAVYLLGTIGTPDAEKALMRLLLDINENNTQIRIALATLNEQDVFDGTIDRAWYDIKIDDATGKPAYEIWWQDYGIHKFNKFKDQAENNQS